MGRMNPSRAPSWKWSVCLLLLFATMLLYMDRQTLSLTGTRMKQEFHLDDAQYGRLEAGFSWAFAAGCVIFRLPGRPRECSLALPFCLGRMVHGWACHRLCGADRQSADRLDGLDRSRRRESCQSRDVRRLVGLPYCFSVFLSRVNGPVP